MTVALVAATPEAGGLHGSHDSEPGPEATGRLVRSAGGQDVDGAAWPGRTGQPLVSGQQGNVEQLGECDVRGVVEGHVLPELPAPGQQRH